MASRDSEENITRLTKSIDEHAEFVRNYLENKPEREKISRAENIHILVALGVLSGFIGLFTANKITLPDPNNFLGVTGFSYVLAIHFVGSLLFIPLKLTTITVRPVHDPDWLKNIDELYLPGVHVFLFFGSIIPLLVLGLGFNFQHEYLAPGYLVVEIVLLIVPTTIYARKFQDKVQNLSTYTSEKEVVVTGSGSGDSAELHIQNPNDEKIKSEDIRFVVDSPEGVEVRIGQAITVKEGIFRPARDLEANEPRIFPVTIKRTAPREGINKDEVDIKTEIAGEIKDSDSIPIRF